MENLNLITKILVYTFEEATESIKKLIIEAKLAAERRMHPTQTSCRSGSSSFQWKNCYGQQSGKCGLPFRLMRRTVAVILCKCTISGGFD
jgi:hypothetical protein